ncbi:MAG: carboxylating nicotinate-nucleotide diphosphorylase [Chloroflexota bacterium]
MKELPIPEEALNRIVDAALAEDTAQGDITSQALLPPDLEGRASLLVKASGVLAGGGVAGRVFRRVDPSLKVALIVADGAAVEPGEVVGTVSGRVVSILKAERVALNFLQRLSGIASLTARYVAEVQGTRAGIYDTRKTTPGLRRLEKYAVRQGGGRNHRMHLGDGILIKDNHLAALRALGLGFKDIVARARQGAPAGTTVEVEVTTLAEAREVVAAGVDIIMLDNMAPEEMQRAVAEIPRPIKTEASGGITLANVGEVARTGVDIISIGALTHSCKALDISLELEPPTLRRP